MSSLSSQSQRGRFAADLPTTSPTPRGATLVVLAALTVFATLSWLSRTAGITHSNDDALYALLSQPDDAGSTVVSVIGTRDLANWCPVLQFTATTFARSFELYDGDFYFDMGTEADPLSADSGDILRVKGQFFTLPAGGC